MVEPRYNSHIGLWECPLCDFKAMSKKVVASHIQREHSAEHHSSPSQNGQKLPKELGQNGNKSHKSGKVFGDTETTKNGKKMRKRAFKVGDTVIVMWDNNPVEVRDVTGWRFFQNRNYVATLHGKRVKVTLMNGQELEGRLGAKDPYFIKLELPKGRRVLINKGAVMLIEPLSGGD